MNMKLVDNTRLNNERLSKYQEISRYRFYRFRLNFTNVEAAAAKRKSLVYEHGKGNKPQAAQAIDEDEVDALFEAGEFGDSNPVALQRTVWWFLSLHFGFRARDEGRKLSWGDVQLQQESDGQEVLVWLAKRGTKTQHGQERGHQRAFQPKIYATNTARCSVSFYKKFRSHQLVEMNAPGSPFYLVVQHYRRSNEEVWYMKEPLGKNEIGKFLSTAAKNAGLHREGKKVTNHSVRKTCISRLLDADHGSRELCSPTEWPQKHGEFTVLQVRQC